MRRAGLCARERRPLSKQLLSKVDAMLEMLGNSLSVV